MPGRNSTNDVDGAPAGIALEQEHAGALGIRGVVLDNGASGHPCDDIAQGQPILRQFIIPVL